MSTAGLFFRLSRMYSPKGYVCILHHEKILQVPETLTESDESNIKRLCALLLQVVMMKDIIKTSLEAVNSSLNGREEHLKSDLMAMIDGSKEGDGIGWAAASP